MIAVYVDTDAHPCDAEVCEGQAHIELVLLVCGSGLWVCATHLQAGVQTLLAHAQDHAATAAMN